MRLLNLLIGTVELRPYVFVFFVSYLIVAITGIGLKRTGLFTITAFLTAFVCEYSSTHLSLGIPFGVYHYVQVTSDKELWIAGVPFMDTLSFTFLAFISYRMALLLLRPLGNRIAGESNPKGNPWITGRSPLLYVAILSGFLMMYLDIIIDPITLQGKKWFLGEIYLYPEHGVYFGVTLANFVGWFIVGLIIVLIFSAVDRVMKPPETSQGFWKYRFQDVSPIVLYFGIMAFNLFITFYIGETSMGLAGVFITLPILLLVLFSTMVRRPGRAASHDPQTPSSVIASLTTEDVHQEAGFQVS
ncbi:MAG TPA: carotenoid biosynthesis protein [Blastocatellia bacterium]